jgi:DNA invertase Pin-like site-specific DNA recombinase
MEEIEQLKKENQQLKQHIEILEKELEKLKLINNTRKKAMSSKASKGKLMSRAPFGYKIEDGKLIPNENSRKVEEIFQEFLEKEISLRELAKKHNLSVNGLKKILKNFTYLGKIKFNNQIHEGTHQPLVSSTLFNHVQDKFEKLGIK